MYIMNTQFVVKNVLKDKLLLKRIPDDSTIEQLCNGNSAVSNEIMGVLISELNLAEDDAMKLTGIPLHKLDTNKIHKGPFVSKRLFEIDQQYKAFDFDTHMVKSDIIKAKMCMYLDGVSAKNSDILEYLNGHNYIKNVVTECNNTSANVVHNSADMERMKEYINHTSKFFRTNTVMDQPTIDKTPDVLCEYEAELGKEFLNGIKGIFNKDCIRNYSSSWNWIRQRDVLGIDPITERVHIEKDTAFYEKMNITTYGLRGIDKSLVSTNIIDVLMNPDKDLKGKKILLIGAGSFSIGESICKMALRGGCHVFVGTSSDNYKRWADIYQSNCTSTSALTVIPCNFGSISDINHMTEFIIGSHGVIDCVFPFAAIKQYGNIQHIGSKHELAHRIMGINTERLIGSILTQYDKRGYVNVKKTTLVLPYSPNIGVIGGDGTYSTSKLEIVAIMNKANSEGWGNRFHIVAPEIGWTKSALMNNLNNVCTRFEDGGGMVFTTEEMGYLVLCLFWLTNHQPLIVDFSGNFGNVSNIRDILSAPTTKGDDSVPTELYRQPQCEYERVLPKVEKSQQSELELDYKKIPVIVGYGEVGTFGNSRIRWEIEKSQQLSLEACIELAWICGKIKYVDGTWIEISTNDSIRECDILEKYHDTLLKLTGIRFIDSDILSDKTDPLNMLRFVEYELPDELGPIPYFDDNEVDKYRRMYTNVQVRDNAIYLPKGSKIMIYNGIKNDVFVGAQIPSGWDPKTFGITDTIINQVDPCTLYTLVALSECFVNAGLTDPYELYDHISLTKVGNCIGTGMGGGSSLKKIFQDIRDNKNVKSDILQETLSNTIAAWVNMLLLGVCGPIITPVQACATSAVSLILGEQMIMNGECEVVYIGGVEDFAEFGYANFIRMGATNNTVNDLAHGRTDPREHSRPTTSTRNGFVEGQGSAVQIMTTAYNALRYGLPIYGIVGCSQICCDGIGKSIPSPGKGILNYLDNVITNDDIEHAKTSIHNTISQLKGSGMEMNIIHKVRDTLLEEKIPNKIQRCLTRYGLNINDMGAFSFHGTSTVGNDKNESLICNTILNKFNYTERPVPVISQKYLTGHAKGAAFGIMLNGVLQSFRSNYIPGNINADDIDNTFQEYINLFYPSQGYTRFTKMIMLHSFGFGQANTQVLMINPQIIFDTMASDEFVAYKNKLDSRERNVFRVRQNKLYGVSPYVEIKNTGFVPPVNDNKIKSDVISNGVANNMSNIYKSEPGIGVDTQIISDMMLSPLFIERNFTNAEQEYCNSDNKILMKQRYAGRWSAKEAVLKAILSNFNENVRLSNSPFKNLKDIEIVHSVSGQPIVVLHNDMLELSQYAGSELSVSISYSGNYAFAMARCDVVR